MKKVLYWFAYILIVAACSNENEGEETLVYTGSRLTVSATADSMPAFFNVMYDSVGVVKSYGGDTIYTISTSLSVADSLTLTLKGLAGELQIIQEIKQEMICRTTQKDILTYQSGKQLVLENWKGDPYVQKKNRKEQHKATGYVDGQSLVLTSNDTIFNVHGIGSDVISLSMVAPVREQYKLKKRR